MIFQLWWKLLRDIRISLIVILLLGFGFQIFWVLVTKRVTTEISPLFRGISDRLNVPEDAFQKHFFSGPGKVMQSIMGGENIRFNRPQDMITVGYLHPLMQILFCLWAIGRAAGAIAGEIDRGTMELLLSQPISRGQIILAHLGVDLVVCPLIALALWLGTLAGAAIAGPFQIDASQFKMFTVVIPIEAHRLEIDPMQLAPSMWNIMVFLFALSGVTLFVSARGRFRTRVMGIMILVTIVQFIINVLGQLWEPIEMLRPLTLFYYYQPQLISLHHEWTIDPMLIWAGRPGLPVNFIWVLFGIGTFGYLSAWRVFVRRDIPAPL